MTRSVKLGAPSLTGKDCTELVAEAFAQATYPLTVLVQNHMPRDVVFPEVRDLFLRHVANAEQNQKTVVISDYDQFQRLASSVEQVAELNGYALALSVEQDISRPTTDVTKTPGRRGRPPGSGVSSANPVAAVVDPASDTDSAG